MYNSLDILYYYYHYVLYSTFINKKDDIVGQPLS